MKLIICSMIAAMIILSIVHVLLDQAMQYSRKENSQAEIQNVDIEQFLFSLDMIKNGVDVKKYTLYDFISSLPEYQLFVHEYEYIKEHSDKLAEYIKDSDVVRGTASGVQSMAKNTNDELVLKTDKADIQSDIDVMLIGTVMIKDLMAARIAHPDAEPSVQIKRIQ